MKEVHRGKIVDSASILTKSYEEKVNFTRVTVMWIANVFQVVQFYLDI